MSAQAERSAPVSASVYDEGPDVVDVLWRFRWPIATVAVAAALVAYLASSLLVPDVYEARTALLLVRDRSASVFLGSDSSGGNAERFLQNQARLIDSPVVLQQVVDGLDEPLSVEGLRERVDVQVGDDSDVVTILARAGTQERAVRVASGVADAYQSAVREDVASSAENAVTALEGDREELRERLDAIGDELTADPGNDFLEYEQDATTAELFSLQEQIEQVKIEASVYGSGARVIEPATAGVAPVQPRPLRNGALGFAVGAVIAATIAWFWVDRSSRALRAPPAPGRHADTAGSTASGRNGEAPRASERPEPAGAEPAGAEPARVDADEAARSGPARG